MAQKALLIGLGQQGLKYLSYFQKQGWELVGCCNSQKTQSYIQEKYNIPVSTSYKKLVLEEQFDVIIVCVPPEIQGDIALEVAESNTKAKIIIDIPVTWNLKILKKLQAYNNVYFFHEEYFTLFSKTLEKISVRELSDITVTMFSSEEDIENILARKVSYIHVFNNFLHIPEVYTRLNIEFYTHESENIYYEISCRYKDNFIKYVFQREKIFLQIGDRFFQDHYNFDSNLKSIIQGNFANKNIKENYSLMCEYVDTLV